MSQTEGPRDLLNLTSISWLTSEGKAEQKSLTELLKHFAWRYNISCRRGHRLLKDGFAENSEEIEHLINKKRVARIASEKRIEQKTQICQKHFREIQTTLWQVKAAELHGNVNQGEMLSFYAGIKIFPPIRSSIGSLKTSDGQTFTTE